MKNIDMLKYRPLPFYFFNTGDPAVYTPENIDRKMKELYDDGFGGCILFNCADRGFDNDRYLTQEWFDVTERFLIAAEKYGLKIWFTDGWRCPSGDVGDKVRKIAPHLYQQRLERNAEGKVVPVPVDWGFPAFEEPESSRLFIELVYEAYKKHLGKYFGNTLEGIFSDADNRRFDAFSASMMKGNYYPWAYDFAENFQKEYHYDIMPHLDKIVDDVPCKEAYDYHSFCEKLYSGWFKNNYDWCRKHNLKYTFHTSDTGPFPRSRCRRSSIFTEGNPLGIGRFCDFPGTDHELLALDGGTHFDSRLVPLKVSRGSADAVYRTPSFAETKYDLRAKYTSAAAHLNGKEGAMSELFAVTNWGATPDELRRIAAWQLLQGITFFVPHGIHHHFNGYSKYMAPPEQHMASGGSIRELNDFISKYTYIATRGVFAPSVFVSDISERVRAGEQDVENFFTFTDQLNHAGISYEIVPEEDPRGIRTLGSLPELPEREFTFTGGDLLAMRRKTESGYFWLVCNLWEEKELSGTFCCENRSIELTIAPGEIAVIGGDWEEYRTPAVYVRREELAFPAPVRFSAPNRIPFHYNSGFRISAALEQPLTLLIPEEFAAGASFDGALLKEGKSVSVYNENYVSFTVAGDPGEHCFVLPVWENRPLNLGKPDATTGNDAGTDQDFKFQLPVYLEGEFDAVPVVENPYDHQVYQGYYILQFHAPAKCDIILSPRRKTLASGSWAEQGQPFYSGSAVYRFDVSKASGHAVLDVPEAAVRVEAFLDGKACGVACFSPFTIDLGEITQAQTLELRVTNTPANELEEFLAPSGLAGGAGLLFY